MLNINIYAEDITLYENDGKLDEFIINYFCCLPDTFGYDKEKR